MLLIRFETEHKNAIYYVAGKIEDHLGAFDNLLVDPGAMKVKFVGVLDFTKCVKKPAGHRGVWARHSQNIVLDWITQLIGIYVRFLRGQEPAPSVGLNAFMYHPMIRLASVLDPERGKDNAKRFINKSIADIIKDIGKFNPETIAESDLKGTPLEVLTDPELRGQLESFSGGNTQNLHQSGPHHKPLRDCLKHFFQNMPVSNQLSEADVKMYKSLNSTQRQSEDSVEQYMSASVRSKDGKPFRFEDDDSTAMALKAARKVVRGKESSRAADNKKQNKLFAMGKDPDDVDLIGDGDGIPGLPAWRATFEVAFHANNSNEHICFC